MKKLRCLLFIFLFIFCLYPLSVMAGGDDGRPDCEKLTLEEIQAHARGILKDEEDKVNNLDSWLQYQGECEHYGSSISQTINYAQVYCAEICRQESISNDCDSFCETKKREMQSIRREYTLCSTALLRGRANTSGSALGVAWSRNVGIFLNTNGGCWFCPIYKIIFDTINRMATAMYINLRDLFLTLVIFGTFAWLLWTVLVFITTIHGPNVGELMTTLFKGLGTAMLVSIVLNAHPSFITRYIVDPVVAIGTEISKELMYLQNGSNENETITYTVYENRNSCGTVEDTRTIQVCPQPTTTQENQNMMLSQDFYWSIDCLLRKVSLELIFGMSLGSTIVTHGLTAGFKGVMPDFVVMFIGFAIIVAYISLYVMVPLKLVDVLIRMGFILILLPLLIAAMTTKYTRSYAKKGWDMFVSTSITFIALALSITFSLILISTAIS